MSNRSEGPKSFIELDGPSEADYELLEREGNRMAIIYKGEKIGLVEFEPDVVRGDKRYAAISWFVIYDEFAGNFHGPMALNILVKQLQTKGFAGLYADRVVNESIHRMLKHRFPDAPIPEFKKHESFSVDF